VKILHITKQFEDKIFGGVENLIDQISLNSKKLGIISDVYTLKKKKIKKKKYKVFFDKQHFSFFSTPISLNCFYNFYKTSKKYDIINFHFPWPFMDILSFLVSNKKILITYHSDIINKNFFYYIYFPLMFLFFLRSKKIVVTSKQYFNSSSFLKFFKKKIMIIPIGIKQFSFFRKPKKKIYKKYFIFVGNLRDYKGLKYLIEAFKSIDCNLIIVGNGKENKIVKENIKNRNNILHLTRVSESEKAFLIKNSLGLILPSIDRREAFGIALIEASSLGKPLISTKVNSGSSFINLNYKTGLEIKPKSVSNIIKACNFLIKYKRKSQKMGHNSYNRFKNIFTIEVMIKKYFELFVNFKSN
jgi:glycosyltransferase involved in cell wall biosynthesis